MNEEREFIFDFMKCSQKTLQTLEFDKIITQLKDCAVTEGGKKKAQILIASDSIRDISLWQRQTSDGKALIGTKGYPPISGVFDINDSIERAQKGAALTPKELMQIAKVLTAAEQLCDYHAVQNLTTNSLNPLFERLLTNESLRFKINRAIISEELIADEASSELADIRRHKRSINNKIKDELQRYTTNTGFAKYLQENIVTIRYGRYVIPVKAEYKNEVKGLVHDSSSSGATLFIEPIGIVEANNELRILSSKEKQEIERILSELSAACAEYAEQLLVDYYLISELDFIFAKAELSYRMNASEARFEEGDSVCLLSARHPLLDAHTVVPIDIRIGGEFHTLVITGPNTGGKTVSMKTLGLLCVMAQCGLHIPASSQSFLCVLEGIYTDIGDEQSIEQSLSTFSSHMKNIVHILNTIEKKELVLIDELGAGTDPVEGAALAIAILEDIRRRGALCVATTHYAELKAFALDTPDVMNASCEFDIKTLLPTYRLILGVPGKSNAFAISERLGLPEDIIAHANSLISADNKKFEKVLEKLEQDRIEMEQNKLATEKIRLELEQKKAAISAKLDKEAESSRKEAERLRAEAKRILDSARASSEFVFDELDRIRKQKDKVSFAEELSKSKAAVRSNIRQTDDLIDPIEKVNLGDYKPSHPFKIGDEIYIPSLDKKGKLEKINEKKGSCEVRCGILVANVKKSEIMLLCDVPSKKEPAKKDKKNSKLSSTSACVNRNIKPEIDLRGLNGEEAWFMTDKFIDSAHLAGLKTVTLIHGKGTGALRAALWNNLKKDSRIQAFRAGLYGEGDLGVTVVELK